VAEIARPTKEIAEKVLRKVGFEDRLIGVKMAQMAGSRQFSFYSLQDAVNFLHVDELNDLLTLGSGSSVGYIDLSLLKEWIATVLDDKDLAHVVEKALEEVDSYKERVGTISTIIRKRIHQCKVVLGVG